MPSRRYKVGSDHRSVRDTLLGITVESNQYLADAAYIAGRLNCGLDYIPGGSLGPPKKGIPVPQREISINVPITFTVNGPVDPDRLELRLREHLGALLPISVNGAVIDGKIEIGHTTVSQQSLYLVTFLTSIKEDGLTPHLFTSYANTTYGAARDYLERHLPDSIKEERFLETGSFGETKIYSMLYTKRGSELWSTDAVLIRPVEGDNPS